MSQYSQEQLRDHLDPVALSELLGKLIPPPAAGDTYDTSDIDNGIIKFYNSMISSLYLLLCIRRFIIMLGRQCVLVLPAIEER